MKYFPRVIVPLLLMLLLGAAALFWNGLRSLDAPLNLKSTLRFKVSPGMSFAHLASDLAAQGVVEQPRAWMLYARWKGLASAVKAGEYEIQPGIDAAGTIDQNGERAGSAALLHHRRWLARCRICSRPCAAIRTLQPPCRRRQVPAAQAAGVMEKLGAPGTDAEGQFLPETYRFVGGTTDIELLRIRRMRPWSRNWIRPGRRAIRICRCTTPTNC